MNTPNKIEIYIILAAVALALLVISIFWVLNNQETYSANLNYPEQLAESNEAVNLKKTTAYQGLSKLLETTSVRALVLGDAVPESQGAAKIEETSWPMLVSNNLQDKYPGTLQWSFKTTPKCTITDILSDLSVITKDVDLILLCVGRNDWATLSAKEFEEKYEKLLAQLKLKNSEATIFLVVEPPVKSVAMNNKSFPYRQIIMDLGLKYNLPVIDQWSAFINHPSPLAELLADDLNPNDQGYSVFANEVLKEFNDYLIPKY